MKVIGVEVAEFHRLYNRGDLSKVYDEAGPKMKESTSKERFVDFVGMVRQCLGPELTSFSVSSTPHQTSAGKFLIVILKTRFQNGTTDESFVFSLDAPVPTLAGYQVRTDTLSRCRR